MDREYLEDYQEKEIGEYKRLVEKRILDGKFSFGEDRYPPDDRFVNLQEPVAFVSHETANLRNIWAQVPFCGSLITLLPPIPRHQFEAYYFKVSDIPEIIDFVKKTGKLQVTFRPELYVYEGLDFLDPFFEELHPPAYIGAPSFLFGEDKAHLKAIDSFYTLGKVRFMELWRKIILRGGDSFSSFSALMNICSHVYAFLKLWNYTLAEYIENLMIDDPVQAYSIIYICRDFILSPVSDLRSSLRNFTLKEIRSAGVLPTVYQPQEMQFPYEIGKFLMKKLTYAAQDMRACYDIIDHYDSCDLQKIQESLNDAIVTNHPDIVNENAKELSEILDNVWNDKTIPRRIENIKIGVPLSIAAIGGIAGGLVGGLAGVGTGGFLAELGFKIAEKAADKFFDVKGEGLSGNIAKLRTKSYQANVYDFKKQYKDKIVKEKHM